MSSYNKKKKLSNDNYKNKWNKDFMKKFNNKYIFYIGSSRQSADYTTTSQYLINNVKKIYQRGNNISEALRLLKRPDTTDQEPTLAVSSSADTAVKERKDKEN